VLLVILLAVCSPITRDAHARNNPVIYTFGSYPTDGAHPLDSLVQGSDGSFYGTTSGGGTNNAGTVFTITAQGTLSTLHLFNGGDGYGPWAGLVQGSDGNFYGTTEYGGASNAGGVFQITSAGTLTLLHSFSGTDGEYPLASLVQGTDSNFYGTTSVGGTNGAGTVFKMTTQGTLTTLYQFGGGSDGSNVWAGLVQGSDGNFYGTTKAGGLLGLGTVFKMTAQGTLTTLYQFSGSDGDTPLAALVQGSDGNFYGTTTGGRTNGDSTVFRITSAGTLTTLHSFNNGDGAAPEATLVQANDGNFYGTTFQGGTSTNCPGGCGTAFQITSAGTLTVLYSFSGSDGYYIHAGLVQGSDGNFYGTASYGGTNDDGTVFRLIVPFPNSWINSGGGKWETGANWSLGAASSSGDAAEFVTNAATKTVTIDATTVFSNAINGCLTISNLYIAGTANSTNTLFLSNAGLGTPLDILNSFTITANGMLLVTNSVLRVDSLSGGSFSIDGGVEVSGSGFVITTNNSTAVGNTGVGQMTVSNGTWVAQATYVGFNPGSQGTLTIAGGTNSLSSYLSVGRFSNATGTVWVTGGQLIVTNSATSVGDGGGGGGCGQMTVSNGTWLAQNVYVGTWYGSQGGPLGSGTLTIAGGTSSVSSDLYVGNSLNTTGAVWVTGGQLTVTTNIVVGNQGFGRMTVSNGTVTVGSLIVTNNINGPTINTNLFTLAGGVVNSAGAVVTNGLTFVDGDGVNASTYQLLGGVHSFANGLHVRTNAALTGCGAIYGNVVVDSGGTVLANCGGNLNFTGTMTNNGTVTASNGTVLNFYGLVVNNGVVNATNGGAQFYGGIANAGTILTSPETNSWSDSSGKWENGNNWSRAAAPSITDLADVIGNAGNNTVTIDATTSSNFPNSLTISNLIVGAPGPMTNTLLLSDAGTNAPLVVSGSVSVIHHGSVILTNSALQVGSASGGALTVDGQLTLDSGMILVSSNLLVGLSNPLSLVTIWGGALYVTNAAHNAVSEVRYGTLVLSGGVFFTDSLLITNTGASFLNDGGTFTITGLGQVDQGTQTVASGTTQLSSNLVVGTSANSTGTVNVTGGQLIATNAPITIGNLGVGSMTVSSGTVSTTGIDIGAGTNSQGTLTLEEGSTVVISSNLTAGSASGATGTISVTGGQLVATNGVIGVGNDGTAANGFGVGTMTVSNGTVLGSSMLLGSSVGGQGQLTVQPGGLVSLVGTNAELVANDLTVDGGDVEILNGIIYCGESHPGAMTMNTGTANCQITYVGYDSQGTLTMLAGQMTVSSLLEIGFASGSTGSVWVSGGQLTATALATTIGNQGVGQMSISNGIVTMADVFVGNSGNPSTLTLAGGTLTVNSLVLLNPSSQFLFSGGWLNALGITNSNGQTLTLGNGVSPITLNLLGGISSLGNGLEISANATLTGCGTDNGNVTIDSGGTVLANCGTLTFTGSLINNGTMRANGGSMLECYGTVINNGIIDAMNGGTNFHGGFVNNGTVLTASSVKISQVSKSGQDFVVQMPSVTGHTYQLQYTTSLTPANWTFVVSKPGTGGVLILSDPGGAANPRRFYRVQVTAP
jgi:uncharacterized repeat protein (TIGR03803 family)